VVTSPSARITTASPAISHQPAWVEAAKLLPITPDTTPPQIAPITATPSVIPTWRLVDATADATPA
jgi:hypothetical protein